MADLLPCPFCGRHPETEDYTEYWAVHCIMHEHTAEALGDTRDKAIAKWNTRGQLEPPNTSSPTA